MVGDPGKPSQDPGATGAGPADAESPSVEEPLLADLAPEAFRRNAFRVTGLAVDATPREVSRHQDRLRLLEALGTGARPAGALDLDPPPDADAIREAVQRLHDPRRRLIDEFFWFWPRDYGQSQEDPALATLVRGDVGAAAQAWEAEERAGDAVVAPHNLAVLGHVLLLDREQSSVGTPRSGLEEPRHAERWEHALDRWRRLLVEDRLWLHVRERIRQLDDPRLPAEMAERLRAELPFGLLSINAQLALRAAERADVAEVEHQLSIMRRWDAPVAGGDVPLAEAATLHAATPLRERLRVACEGARAGLKTPAHGGDAGVERLLEQTQSLLDVLDRLFPATHAVRIAAHDEVADALLATALASTKTKPHWEAVCGTLERAFALAASPTTRERVANSLEFAQEHRDQQTCWFCGAAPPDDRSAVTVPMYGEVTRAVVHGGTQLHWRPYTVQVPRCRVCRDAHGELDRRGTVGALVGFLVGIVPSLILAGGNLEAMVLIGAPCALLLGALGFTLGRRRARERFPNVKPLKTKGDHPQIARLLARGWAFGSRPSK